MQQSKYNNSDNVKVVVRVRPPLQRQITSDIFISTVQVLQDKKRIQLFQYIDLHKVQRYQIDLDQYIQNPNNYRKHQFIFDHVYDDESSQQQIYQNTASISVSSALQGYNATIFAYGQTGTGKTYTMQGFRYNLHDDQRGIIPRAAEDIFSYIRDYKNNQITYMVRVSYIQIYNQVLTDLLRQQKQKLAIRENPIRGIFIEGVSSFAVRSPQQMIQLIKKGAKSRATAKTNMNQLSSRSHAVFIITIQQIYHNDNGQNQGKTCKVAKLNIVDLAGSERVNVSGAMGDRLKQCQSINKSLHTLGLVIKNLTQTRSPSYIPYRNSNLTRLLSDSLGGNCKTTMFTMISPSPDAFSQSASSLNFAYSAKSIKNKPIINQDFDQKALIRKYQNQLQKLRTQLTQKNKVIIDKAKLLQLQEQKKRIEQDKNNVEKALQQRSKQFFKERQQKKKLQQKIKAFNSQLIYSGHQSQYEKALHDQKKLINQYQKKIKNLQAGKKQPNQAYDSQLFDKQNLILMSLAAKLNQRDQVNMHLNQQLCACERIHEDDEKQIQAKNKRIQQLKSVLRQNKIQIPQEQKNMLLDQKQQKEQKIDGVCVGGQMTYNVTNKNLKQAQEQIFNLKQRNQQHKQQIFRLKQQLSKKDSHKKPVFKQELQGYKSIKQSINIITRGLQKKENTDMKQIVSQIFKIKKIVEKVDDTE